jgi:hypothetical protein
MGNLNLRGRIKGEMNTAAELRNQIESALANRFPGAFSPRHLGSPERLPCGLAEVDAMLGGGLGGGLSGGFPLGAIVELTGVDSSGRTTLALSTLAGVTQQGKSCAYVDVSDALDPVSAAALGVDLSRLLWVRAPGGQPGVQPTRISQTKKPAWAGLDRALRATDLLLSTGGFCALVLDMADTPPEQARRVPLATWYRFRLQAEKSRTLFILMTRVPCANSCAAVSLNCRQGEIDWTQAARNSPRLLAGLRYGVSLERGRAANDITRDVIRNIIRDPICDPIRDEIRNPTREITRSPTRKKPAACAEICWSSSATGSR